MYTKFEKYHVHLKKKLLRRADKMANIEKENSKPLSEEAIDTLINCFLAYGMLPVVIIKSKTESFCL